MPDGRLGESLAAEFLRSKGYDLIAQNYRTRLGEIDIIAQIGDTIHLIEVKTRSSDAFGTPAEAVTERKYLRMQQLAADYMATKHNEDTPWQIDILSVYMKSDGTVLDIQQIEYV